MAAPSIHDVSSSVAAPMKLTPVLVLTALFFVNFIARVALSPLLPAIEKDLRISHAEGGTLFFFISVGYFTALLGSGAIASRWTHRRVILLSAACVGVSMLGAASGQALWQIRLWTLGVGLAAGLYLPSGMATLTAMVDPGQWGRAISIHELAPTLAYVVAPLLAEALMLWLPWRGVLVLLGLGTFLVGLVFARLGTGGEFCGQAPDFRAVTRLVTRPVFWGMIAVFTFGIAGTLGVYTMLPVYLVHEVGLARPYANTLVGLSRVAPLATVLLAGWATDRFGPRRMTAAALLATAGATMLLGVLGSRTVVAVVFVQAMAAVAFYPPGFAALSRVVAPEWRNIAVSLTLPTAFLVGGGLVPTGIGLLGDAGAFPLAFVLLGGIMAMAGVLALAVIPEPGAASRGRSDMTSRARSSPPGEAG